MRHALLHGQDVAYDEVTGHGPVLVLVHGIGSSSRTWDTVVPLLAKSGAAVVTVDLPGHGQSGKDRGDYSLGASACTLRDLLDHLGHDQVVLVGHSLGGGIALQFAYQFPDRCDGLVLVASGGLGREASLLLRAASLPGAELVLPVLTHERTRAMLAGLGSALARVRVRPDIASDESLRTLDELAAPEARAAFLATLRGVMDRSGQRVSAISKLPTAARVPVLLVWGDRDPILPLQHGRDAAELIDGSRLVVFPGAGHEPHRFDPERFARLLSDDVVRQPRSRPA